MWHGVLFNDLLCPERPLSRLCLRVGLLVVGKDTAQRGVLVRGPVLGDVYIADLRVADSSLSLIHHGDVDGSSTIECFDLRIVGCTLSHSVV